MLMPCDRAFIMRAVVCAGAPLCIVHAGPKTGQRPAGEGRGGRGSRGGRGGGTTARPPVHVERRNRKRSEL